jgi:hypothetical protein
VVEAQQLNELATHNRTQVRAKPERSVTKDGLHSDGVVITKTCCFLCLTRQQVLSFGGVAMSLSGLRL